MTSTAAIATSDLPPITGHERGHSRKAMSHMEAMFAWLPAGKLVDQLAALQQGLGEGHADAIAAAHAWTALVRAHALDFHADAGRNGEDWQQACIDAQETWLLIRRQSCNLAENTWALHTRTLTSQMLSQVPPDFSQPELWQCGGKGGFEPTTIDHWTEALAAFTPLDAVEDASALVQQWPGLDWPGLGLALGAQWALSIVGPKAGCQSLLIGQPQGQVALMEWH